MYRFVVWCGSFATVLATSVLAAWAVSHTSEVTPLGISLPIAEGGLLGLVAASVIGGVWLVRRKR